MSDSDSYDSDSDSSSVGSSPSAETTSPILEWYSKLYSRRVDIVGDYAGNELFLVEGDSILLDCFDNEQIDFDAGFQLLHATYAVEHFLHGLVARRCNFHIAFFDQHRELCVPPWATEDVREKYLLARAAIIRHLRINLSSVHPGIEIHIFPSVQSPEFAQYLNSTDIYFVMSHDGSSSDILKKRALQDKRLDTLQDEETRYALDPSMNAKRMFRLLLHWFMSHGYNAALINGLEWLDTKVITTVLEGTQYSRSQILTDASAADSSAVPSTTDTDDKISEFVPKIQSVVEKPLTERDFLTVFVVSMLSREDGLTSDTTAYLRHAALLTSLPLSKRSLKTQNLSADNSKDFLSSFTKKARKILQSHSWSDTMLKAKSLCDIADLVDGRLYAACIQDSSFGDDEHYKVLLGLVNRLNGAKPAEDASGSTGKSIETLIADHADSSAAKRYAVLPFSNEVFEKHLAPIQLAEDQSGEVVDATSALIFREVSHWHNSKRPIDPKIREDQLAKSQKQQFFARRRNQWFMAEMMAYAASLTNAVGRALEPEIITTGGKSRAVQASTSEKKEEIKAKAQAKSGKKPVLTKKQAMMAEIAANKSKKDEASSEKILASWRLTCKTLNQEPVLVTKYQKTKQFILTLNTDLKRETLEAEVRLFLLNILLDMWITICRNKKKSETLHLAALIFDNVKSFTKLRVPIPKSVVTSLTTTVKTLGLPTISMPAPTGDRQLSFTFALPPATAVDLAVSLPAKEFQLLHCGPYFERSIDSAPDPRTPFEPDAWQRKVLDEIDAKRSLLVVAPTSAGKTFISFYAMQQVLESSDDDVLVYVAPTKALVNQIAAEVQARFSKQYKYAGNSVWGIHTRDYRINNPIGCQVLVTVPHILQIMLLAPNNAKSWSERVKWIIFDEVHCLGQAEDGLVWEQLLLLAPCPIIALSATIGNPQEFSSWLQSTQNAVGNKLTMVQHPHRYSDLRKFVYEPPKNFEFTGLSDTRAFAELALDNSDRFSFVHPVASLINRSRGMPDDFGLEARDCLMLWESMSKHQTADYPVSKDLGPTQLPGVIRKLDIIGWETSLKAILKEWMADPKSPFEAVFNELNGNIAALESRAKAETATSEMVSKTSGDKMHGTQEILPLLVSLHEQDGLPGIVFNYDRGACEAICQTLLKQLSDAETAWKESSPKWKSTLQSWESWKKAMAKAEKTRRPPKASNKKGAGDEEGVTKEDMMRDTASTEASPWASFNPEDPQDGFHFADKKKLSKDEMAKQTKELIRRDLPQWQLDALKRGIGVHHAGMNRKYRQVVEMFFRKGYLRVVIATGTLALGINMPCKTVVFSGDSVFLTALNYRQAAGRAGRRGFDMLGNVVFHGITTNKMRRLISSKLPGLHGHFPISTTLVLRLCTLLNESKESPFAIRSINALLSQPRLYLGGEESKMTVLHHLRFSIEYLRRQYLLDSRGAPLNFAGCVSHLYFTENSAFAFHALLKDGYFHDLCVDIEKNKEKVLWELMLTLSHLFGRQYCKKSDEEFVAKVIKKSGSMVFLPAMPEKAANALRAHNRAVLDIYTAYVQTFVEQHIKEPDNVLPLTNRKIGSDSLPKSAEALSRSVAPTVRSNFVALSGHDDQFSSVHDLCTTARSGVFLEEAVVPYVGIYPDESELPLNAYLLDFFNHGDVTALAKANRIRSGEVWFVLNDFSMVLATIETSLANFLKLSSASDLDFTDVRGEGEEEEERREDQFMPADADSGYETGSTASFATNTTAAGPGANRGLPIQNKKKKKVADSWDDDADEEDFQAGLAAEKEKKREEMAKERQRLGAEKPAWEEGVGLMNVYKAFKALRAEFDTKFRAMWA